MPSMQVNPERCQVAIIGSGFPGAIFALILGKLGLDVVVIDKKSHPRFAIGESSTPIADAYLARISKQFAIPELLPLSTFARTRLAYPDLTVGRKRGFSYFWHEVDKPFKFTPEHDNEMVVAASASDELSDSHWLRSDVDHQIVRWFDKYQVTQLDNCTVQSIERCNQSWQINYNRDGKTDLLEANYFVDASGSAGIGIRTQGGKSKLDEMWTNTSAVFAHFEGLERWSDMAPNQHRIDYPFVNDDAAVHHLVDSGWMWQLRFHTGLTSCGIVRINNNHTKRFAGDQGSDSGKRNGLKSNLKQFLNTVSRYPSLESQFRSSVAVTPAGGAFYRDRLQHWYDLAAGPGWCALPHSVGFVDPLHSKGLAHALSGVYRLALIFAESEGKLNCELDQKASLLAQAIQQEIAFLDRLIAICYLSLDSFELFQLATFWYFAAATNFEHRCSIDQELDRPFLLADDKEFQTALNQYADQLKMPDDTIDEKTIRMQNLAAKLLRPFDQVGLFSPPVPNMYPNTSAPENTKSA